MMPNYDI